MDTREEYEQLKRKNRNRLIGAIVIVAALGLLLLAVTDKKTPTTAPEVKIAGKPQQPVQPLNLPTGKEEKPAEKPAEEKPIVIDSVAQPEPYEPVIDTPEPITTEKPIKQPEKTVAEKPVKQPEKTVAEKPIKQPEKTVTEKPVKQPEKSAAEKPKAEKQQAEKKSPEKPAQKQAEKLSPKDILEGKTTASYFVQLGAFKTHAQADTQRAKLAQVGISSQIQQGKDKNGNAVYRVRTNTMSKAEADKAASNARAKKFDAMVIKQ